MVSAIDAYSPTFAPAANSSVSDPTITNILAFNFKETKKSAEIDRNTPL